jgi:hypothetical protein
VGAEEIVGRAPRKRYGGENVFIVASKFPPPDKTRPSGSRSATEWYPRNTESDARVVHRPVAGSQISAAFAGLLDTAVAVSLPALPPVTRTLPSGRIVALCCLRANAIGEVARQTGEPDVKSMISAVFVGATAVPDPA